MENQKGMGDSSLMEMYMKANGKKDSLTAKENTYMKMVLCMSEIG